MSTTAVAPAAASSTHAACAANLYNIPVTAAACAMPYGGNHTDIMASCCGSTQVVSYYDDCGLFCLAQGQSVGDLTNCLYSKGAAYQDVFCNDKTTATATGGPVSVAASAHASFVTGGGSEATGGSSGPGGSTSSSSEESSSSDSSSAASNSLSWASFLKAAGVLVLLQAVVLLT